MGFIVYLEENHFFSETNPLLEICALQREHYNKVPDALAKLGPHILTIFQNSLPSDLQILYVQDQVIDRQLMTEEGTL